jgi:outer membrane protein assembly factor BamB
MRNHCNSCVLYKGYLYGLDGQMGGRAALKCLKPETGEVVWEQKDRVLSPGGIMIADGKIIAMLDKGTLLVAEAKPDGYEELARAKVLEGQCWTVPVLANGKIYCRNNNPGVLVCLDVSQ